MNLFWSYCILFTLSINMWIFLYPGVNIVFLHCLSYLSCFLAVWTLCFLILWWVVLCILSNVKSSNITSVRFSVQSHYIVHHHIICITSPLLLYVIQVDVTPAHMILYQKPAKKLLTPHTISVSNRATFGVVFKTRIKAYQVSNLIWVWDFNLHKTISAQGPLTLLFWSFQPCHMVLTSRRSSFQPRKCRCPISPSNWAPSANEDCVIWSKAPE